MNFKSNLQGGDIINIYYGSADMCVAMATASIKELFKWLENQNEN